MERRTALRALLLLALIALGLSGTTDGPTAATPESGMTSTMAFAEATSAAMTTMGPEAMSSGAPVTMPSGSGTTADHEDEDDDDDDHEEVTVEHPPFDGWFNNWANPNWGGAETPLYRLIHPEYSDGSYEPSGINRPNPFNISDAVFSGPTGHPSYRGRTALLVFFGQQVVEEVLDAQRPGCPPEYFNIPIPKGHAQYDEDGRGGREMPFLRSRYDQGTGFAPNVPREQLNEISAFIDGGLMYGPNKAWADGLRKFEGGRLRALNDTDSNAQNMPALNDIRLPMANPSPPFNHALKPIKRFFMLGNPRGNENPFLLTFGVLWFRYHNLIARRLETYNPNWSDERLFLEARKFVIGVHQKIVAYDWLPSWLNATLDEYKGYDPSVHPGIAHVFQSAAMRFGHTLVPPGVFRRMKNCDTRNTTGVDGSYPDKEALRTCNTFWNSPDLVAETDIDELLMGMATQITEREDNIVTPDLHGDVFGPLEFPRRDLMAVNIQRARDHGLTDYNSARETLGLPRIENWIDINPDLFAANPELLAKVRDVYNDSLDDVDIWPAGLLETTPAGPGPLFTRIILNQFTRIRDGDRFWFENNQSTLYSPEDVESIRQVTLRQIILDVTNLTDDDLPQDIFFEDKSFRCDYLGPINHTEIGQCYRPPRQESGTYFDYFSGSEASYALSFFFLLASFFLVVGLLMFLARAHDKQVKMELDKTRRKRTMRSKKTEKPSVDTIIHGSEWVGKKKGLRTVSILLDTSKKHIVVKEEGGARAKVLRTIDLSLMLKNQETTVDVLLSTDGKRNLMSLRVPKEYDLILQFEGTSDRDMALDNIRTFMSTVGLGIGETVQQSHATIKNNAYTKEQRQELLERFFRAIANHAFEKGSSRKSRRDTLNFNEAKEILQTELTRYEFAEALSLKPDSLFVDSMFRMVDKNQNGYISFREFLDFFVIFAKGDAEAKARLMFDMYDLDQTETLSRDEFKTMLKSMVELANETIEEENIQKLIDRMFTEAGFESKSNITFADFKRLLKDYENELGSSQLTVGGLNMPQGQGQAGGTLATRRARQTIITLYGDIEPQPEDNRRLSVLPSVQTTVKEEPQGKYSEFLHNIQRLFVYYKLHIFWCSLYTLVAIGVFVERAYYYSVEREHAGLRRIAGYGVTITRGAASGMMFTYSCLLVTMCRNLITFLRETFLHSYIPFDAAIDMHKYIAFMALFFTLLHIVGHMINFYHISTQTANDLSCLFRNFFHPTDYLPKFHYWCWNTLTGFTGVLLTVNLFFIYVFAIQYARRHAFRAFWYTHNSYVIFFMLMILHGAGRLVQPPFLHFFLLGPAVLFTIDRLISVSRKKTQIAVIKAELLPSDVTNLVFKRPNNFDYKSGQWLRIACLVQGENEYHPFTLTSAPHEKHLSLHIRAVGPWTINLRRTYDPELVGEHAWPTLYLDGPYGEGHQDWYRYQVAILVGGGIGVTPFASILKDIAHQSKRGATINCKKVYFLWVTRTQRQFEWMTDIIREVEDSDLVSVHIFITQFKEKFDIRTTMLYICERHFQKYSERSLFTGLRSITHFGRPDFKSFLNILKDQHSDVEEFGVFSCGPPPMTATVEQACTNLNKDGSGRYFVHHFENF